MSVYVLLADWREIGPVLRIGLPVLVALAAILAFLRLFGLATLVDPDRVVARGFWRTSSALWPDVTDVYLRRISKDPGDTVVVRTRDGRHIALPNINRNSCAARGQEVEDVQALMAGVWRRSRPS
jgi:hypothetical protein